jgi:hypothetical protein
MYQFSAVAFFWCGRALRSIREDCLVGSIRVVDEQPFFDMSRLLDSKAREKGLSHLMDISIEFRKIGLGLSAGMADEIIAQLRKGDKRNFQWMHDQAETIERLAEKEANDRFFLYIPPERARFWPTEKSKNIFGDEVAAKFPSVSFDAGNSGVCLATMMPTASVFHLMRVLELGLKALGKEFGVSTEQTNWQNAIEQIESKIRKMATDQAWKSQPDWKELQQYFSDCATHFSILKDAWRNYTMHAHAAYTDDQAEVIFLTVKAFMQKLAMRLSE